MMRLRYVTRTLFLLTGLLLLGGCELIDAPDAPPEEAELMGTDWVLIRAETSAGEVRANELQGDVTLSFTSEEAEGGKTLTGSSVCNGFSGIYRMGEANGIIIIVHTITTSDCGAENNAIEEVLLTELQEGTTFDLEDDELTITYDAGEQQKVIVLQKESA